MGSPEYPRCVDCNRTGDQDHFLLEFRRLASATREFFAEIKWYIRELLPERNKVEIRLDR